MDLLIGGVHLEEMEIGCLLHFDVVYNVNIYNDDFDSKFYLSLF